MQLVSVFILILMFAPAIATSDGELSPGEFRELRAFTVAVARRATCYQRVQDQPTTDPTMRGRIREHMNYGIPFTRRNADGVLDTTPVHAALP